jgi:hypothetical protein
LLALIAVVGCGSSAVSSAVTQATPTASSSAPVTTVIVALDCSDTTAAEYDPVGSMHTVVPSGQPITATITTNRDAWCTGGEGEADVTMTNTGPGIEHLQNAQLVLSGGAAKWPLQSWEPFDLAAGESRALQASFQLPDVNPGRYGLLMYGYDGYTTVELEGPTVCATSDLMATGTTGDSAMGNIRTDIAITNVGTNPCLLSDPIAVAGLDPDGSATPLTVTKGTYFGDPPPLASHVLPISGRAVLNLNTGWPCLDDAHPSVMWSGLRLTFLPGPSFETSSVDVTVDIDTACGLGISALGGPEAG